MDLRDTLTGGSGLSVALKVCLRRARGVVEDLDVLRGRSGALGARPSALKTASLPAQRAANDDAGDGCFWQYDTSLSVKLRATNVGLCEGTAEMSSGAAVSDS